MERDLGGGGLREEKDGRMREWKDRGRKKNGEEGEIRWR